MVRSSRSASIGYLRKRLPHRRAGQGRHRILHRGRRPPAAGWSEHELGPAVPRRSGRHGPPCAGGCDTAEMRLTTGYLDAMLAGIRAAGARLHVPVRRAGRRPTQPPPRMDPRRFPPRWRRPRRGRGRLRAGWRGPTLLAPSLACETWPVPFPSSAVVFSIGRRNAGRRIATAVCKPGRVSVPASHVPGGAVPGSGVADEVRGAGGSPAVGHRVVLPSGPGWRRRGALRRVPCPRPFFVWRVRCGGVRGWRRRFRPVNVD